MQDRQIEYPLKSDSVSAKFESEKISIGVIGNRERWYKGIDDAEFDGDSLYAKKGQGSFTLVDGFNINDVGNFSVYNDSFREFNKGKLMIAYFKQRQLSKEDKQVNLKLLVHNGNEFQTHNIWNYSLNPMLTLPVMPQVAISDSENKLIMSYIMAEPNSMSFSGSRRESKTLNFSLGQYGINLDKIINPEISIAEAKGLVNSLGPHLGFENTYDPVFAEGRKDICAVRRLAENGNYGYDTVYLLWKGKDGELQHEKIDDSKNSQKYVFIDELVEENGNIIIKVRNTGCRRDITRSKQKLGI
jgi:hypothetical protein